MRTVVTLDHRHPSQTAVVRHRSPRRALSLLALGAALVVQAGWAAVGVAAAEPSTADEAAGLRPTIHYEEVVRHAKDRIDFQPGGRVTVGFRPRTSDRWAIGGRTPRALPAGRLDGRTIRNQAPHAPVTKAPLSPDASIAPTPHASANPTEAPESSPPPSASGGPVGSAGPAPTDEALPSAEPAPVGEPSPAPSASTDPTPEPSTGSPIDSPTLDPSDVVAATGASWSMAEAATDPSTDAAVGSTLRREVFGFLPYWELNSSSTTLDYARISTIAYFGVGADGSGNLMKRDSSGATSVGWSGWTSSKMTSLINTAHTNRTRVVLTVQSFAWETGGATRQKALLGSSTARLNLARQIAAAVRDRGADGVNLDFEPLASGYATQFTALVRTVRAELDKVARGYQLTFDTTGYIGNYPLAEATAPGGADAIFIMGYDYRSAGSTPVGSVAPLSRTGLDIRETIANYVARVSPSKLILGVPYYGRAWSTDTDAFGAKNWSGAKYGSSATVVYETALTYLSKYGRRYSTTEGVAWTAYRRQNCTTAYGCVMSWRQVYVDDVTALRAKYDLVNQYDLRGAGIWALGYDGTRPELWAALKDKFGSVPDTTPPAITTSALSSPLISPNGDGRLDTVTASLVSADAVRWTLTVSPLSGTTVGSPVRTVSGTGTTPSVTWNGRTNAGAVAAQGQYRLRLAAIDGAGNQSTRDWTVTLDVSAPTLSASASLASLTPNADGVGDTASIAWAATEAVSGVARLYRGTTPIRSWTITGSTGGSIAWDGTDGSGATVADGVFTFRLFARDAAGNAALRELRLTVDRTLLSSGTNPGRFYPHDGDSLAPKATFTYTLARASSVSVKVYRGGTYIRTAYSGRSEGAGAHSWSWDGRDRTGAMAPRGSYTIRVTSVSWIGSTSLAQPVRSDAFATTLSATTLAAGQTLSVTFTTVEPLSATPRVTLDQTNRAAVTKTATSLGGGQYRVTFTVASGGVGRATVAMVGRDTAGGWGGGALPRRGARTARATTSPSSSARLHWAAMSAVPVDPTVSTTTAGGPPAGVGAWVVLPTYDEAGNIRPISAAILEALPGATLLVVDDGSPDGTGDLADALAASDPRIRVRHRPAKQGLGRAYLDGFRIALDGGARIVVQMDADFSHDPAALPGLIGPIERGDADLVLGSRYTTGGGVVDWGLGRRLISRAGSLFARTVLHLSPHDLTGGFKAWRAETLADVPFSGIHAGGYVFQIEMTFRASRAGARLHEVPIVFRDRRVGQSKMSRRIVFEALVVVVQLRAEELRGRFVGRRAPSDVPPP
jgi:dolichol-phosphate mannosyltransferase